MMSAREMFKKLGFEQTLNDSDFIFYEKVEAESCHTRFMFALESRSFEAIFYVDGYGGGGYFIELDEFKVILKQMEELGWLEEEQKQETNLEHYFEYLSTIKMSEFALIDGRVTQCLGTGCSECDFNGDCIEGKFKWLKQPYKKPTYKLTQFEHDLLSVHKDFKDYNQIANQIHLFKMHEKGYFKYIDTKIPIREILDNCEVIK